jgi:hypothetical protein
MRIRTTLRDWDCFESHIIRDFTRRDCRCGSHQLSIVAYALEPGTALLMVLGLVGLGCIKRGEARSKHA